MNLKLLEDELARQKIPYRKFGGKKLTEVAHIKDVLAVLRWVENPADLIASFRVVQLLPGFGPAYSKRVLEALKKGSLSTFKPPSKATEAWSTLLQLIKGLRGKKPGWPAELDTVRAWYKPHCERNYENGDERYADLSEFLTIAKAYKTRRELLTTFALDPPSAAGAPQKAKNDSDLLTLSTIHSAKGQEWRSVFVINVIDGIMPSSMAMTKAETEEERRLLYVAMTRAKDELVLVVPLQSQLGKRANQRTPFIPKGILNRFVQVTHPDGDDVPDSKPRGGKVMLKLPSLLLEAAIK